MPLPVFAFLAFTSGAYEGAIVRDMRLANVLHRRGFPVHVYWVMETNRKLLDPAIPQCRLIRGIRYARATPSSTIEFLGRGLDLVDGNRRQRYLQQHPDVVRKLLENFVSAMCDCPADLTPVRRLEKLLIRDRVTHLLPTFVMTCPLALAAKQRGKHAFDYVATFQGEEIFANYAEERGRLKDYYAVLRRCVQGSAFPAIAVSDDYRQRIHAEMGVPLDSMRTMYPGIELPKNTIEPDFAVLNSVMPNLRRDVPIVTFLGRQDTEKGIDLLLYAVRMVLERGIKMQLVIVGGSSFGWGYQIACKEIAAHLRLEIHWKRRVSDEVKSALYAHSRCVVYPSIHREPFGMVAAETMSYGTPVIVPNLGGITEVVKQGDLQGGITFKVWDTQDLAEQIARLVSDDSLYQKLKSDTKQLAAEFSVDRLADRLLAHIGVENQPG